MKHRTLGQGLDVSAIGIGCMPMVREGNIVYGHADDDESVRTIQEAIELGVTFFDTAEMYGPFRNEELVGRAIKGKRDGLVIATKFALRWNGDIPAGVDGSPENARRACEGSLKRLGVDTIDLFYQHRVDPKTPIEETVGGLAELVKEGKIRHIGLSEAAAETVRRAAKAHPIAALQSEYSIWERDVEDEILPACRENGIGFVPYSPLGRGFLAGGIRSLADLPENDWRHNDPRYSPENMPKNLAVVDAIAKVSARHGKRTMTDLPRRRRFRARRPHREPHGLWRDAACRARRVRAAEGPRRRARRAARGGGERGQSHRHQRLLRPARHQPADPRGAASLSRTIW